MAWSRSVNPHEEVKLLPGHLVKAISRKASGENLMTRSKRRCPNFDEAVEIWRMLFGGMDQHDIAAKFGFNQGRISEVKTGRRFPEAYAEAWRRFLNH
jgi:predicted transcriptional regulator